MHSTSHSTSSLASASGRRGVSSLVAAQMRSRSGTPASEPDRPFDELFSKLQDIEAKLGVKEQGDKEINKLELKV